MTAAMADVDCEEDEIFTRQIPCRRGDSQTTEPEPSSCERTKSDAAQWLWPELKQVASLASSMMLISMFGLLMNPVSIIMCGHLGTPALAGVALATTVINVCVISVAIGLCTACDTVFAQSYGSVNAARVLGTHLIRSVIIIMLFLLPCWAVLLNVETLLGALGQDVIVARIAGNYLMFFAPAVPAMFLQTILIQYLRCQDIVLPTVLISALGFFVNVIMHVLLLFVFNYGTTGSAISQTIAFYTMATILIYYVATKRNVGEVVFTKDVFQDWGPFLHLAMAGLCMVVLEWWAYQIGTLLSGYLGEIHLAATSILFQLLAIAYIFPLGIGLACNIRVGQLLGARDIVQAKRAITIGLSLSVGGGLFLNILLVSLRHYVPLVFTTDSFVDDIVVDAIPFLAGLNVFDAISGTCVGVLRGCGRQVIGTGIMFAGFFLVGLPVGGSLLLLTDLKVSGLYIGFLLGVFTHCWLFGLVLRGTNWEEEVEYAQRRAGVCVDVAASPTSANVDAHELDEMRALLADLESKKSLKINNFFSRLQSRMFPNSNKLRILTTPELITRRGLLLGLMMTLFAIGLACRFLIFLTSYKNLCPVYITSDDFRDQLQKAGNVSRYCYDFYVMEFVH